MALLQVSADEQDYRRALEKLHELAPPVVYVAEAKDRVPGDKLRCSVLDDVARRCVLHADHGGPCVMIAQPPFGSS